MRQTNDGRVVRLHPYTPVLSSLIFKTKTSNIDKYIACVQWHLLLVLQDLKGSLGVRMALGETQIVQETRDFLTDHGVALDSFSQVTKLSDGTIMYLEHSNSMPETCQRNSLCMAAADFCF